jgi:hypothetical protein
MKRSKIDGLFAIALLLFSFNYLQAQEESNVVTVMRAHWNMEYENFQMDEWKKLEMEYHEKVIMKNEYIVGSVVLLHNYTPDNSELLFATAYANWEDIEKAGERNQELAKEVWPGEAERNAFFDKQSEYYSQKHSDEIYSSMRLGKQLAEKPTEPLIYYVRTSHMAPWPEDGKMEEIRSLRTEYVENVIHKNDNVLGYYPMRHLYGVDSREMTEVFVLNSMADLEEMNQDGVSKLIEAHWPDEAARKEFFDAFNKYGTPWHGDLIYSSVPELTK